MPQGGSGPIVPDDVARWKQFKQAHGGAGSQQWADFKAGRGGTEEWQKIRNDVMAGPPATRGGGHSVPPDTDLPGGGMSPDPGDIWGQGGGVFGGSRTIPGGGNILPGGRRMPGAGDVWGQGGGVFGGSRGGTPPNGRPTPDAGDVWGQGGGVFGGGQRRAGTGTPPDTDLPGGGMSPDPGSIWGQNGGVFGGGRQAPAGGGNSSTLPGGVTGVPPMEPPSSQPTTTYARSGPFRGSRTGGSGLRGLMVQPPQRRPISPR